MSPFKVSSDRRAVVVIMYNEPAGNQKVLSLMSMVFGEGTINANPSKYPVFWKQT